MSHYKNDCLDADGQKCSAAPYCRVTGTRRFIKSHEETCGFVKVICPGCETNVIRKLMETSHNCFDSCMIRLDKIENTLDYSYKRQKQQTEARAKFDHVILNLTRKLLMFNKRIE
jgi:hypothetical protein